MTLSRRSFLAAASGLAAQRLAYPPVAAEEHATHPPPATELQTPPVDVTCDNGLRPANGWQVGSSLVLACCFGSDPVTIGGGRWRGSGLSFTHAVPGVANEVLHVTSEAELNIDYWTDSNGLHIVQYTYEPNARVLTPLLEHRFAVARFPALHSLHVMLRVPPDAAARFEEAMAALRAPPTDCASDVFEWFYRIRDFGLLDPERAAQELDGLRGAWWDDGAVAEDATAVRCEIRLLARALTRPTA